MRFVAPFALILAFLSLHGRADACGAFAARRAATDPPYLSVEQVLLVWDRETQDEDLIRETRFERANQSFGFVIPTPTKPEVFAVKQSPFDRLRANMPFEDPRSESRSGSGSGAGVEVVPPPVLVLSKQRIGSFTAFTLSASDAAALDKWLADNGLAMTEEAKPWVEHYVKLGFFFVALRYDVVDAGAATGMTSETVRIRFKTPNPYYPYLEPPHPATTVKQRSRLLSGWLVTREPMLPVAARPHDHPRWGRPWSFGSQREVSAAEVAATVGPELAAIVPKVASPLVVQTFRDEKVRRDPYGDVLLVPATPAAFTDADRESRRFLLGVIDPEPPAPAAAAPAASSSSAVATDNGKNGKKDSGCAAAPGSGNGWGFLIAIGAMAILRRRALMCLALVGCRGSSSVTEDAAVAPAPVEQPKPESSAEREKRDFAILAGEVPQGGIPSDPAPQSAGSGFDVQIGAVAFPSGGTVPDVERALSLNRARIRRCYQNAAGVTPPRDSELSVVFVIGANGEVKASSVTSHPPIPKDLEACVGRSIRGLQLAAVPARADVTASVKISVTSP